MMQIKRHLAHVGWLMQRGCFNVIASQRVARMRAR
jgi:hypothetical protein